MCIEGSNVLKYYCDWYFISSIEVILKILCVSFGLLFADYVARLVRYVAFGLFGLFDRLRLPPRCLLPLARCLRRFICDARHTATSSAVHYVRCSLLFGSRYVTFFGLPWLFVVVVLRCCYILLHVDYDFTRSSLVLVVLHSPSIVVVILIVVIWCCLLFFVVDLFVCGVVVVGLLLICLDRYRSFGFTFVVVFSVVVRFVVCVITRLLFVVVAFVALPFSFTHGTVCWV